MNASLLYSLFIYRHCRALTFRIAVCIFFIYFIPNYSYCQADDTYDDISITFNVQRVGSCEIPAIIHGESAYLPIKEVFDFLKIKNSPSADLDIITGFFINPKAAYTVEKNKNRIIFEDKIFDIKPADLIQTQTGLFLKSKCFEDVFGLGCNFNFRSLSVILNTKLDLPAMRELKQEQMRKNITQLKGERKADTTIKQTFPLFHLGMADWSIINTNDNIGNSNTRLTLNAGAIVAGGEANVYLNYNSHTPFNAAQQFYRWKLVNNNNAVLRQLTIGNIFVQPTSSVYGTIKGVQISNTPTTYRKSFGTYRLSDKTEPGWLVELYVNNVLVNYTKADASGFFTFEVPLVYGNSAVKLRFFGPWGEEKISEQNISIPFNFLPVHQFEYTLSAAVIDDEEKSKYSRLNLNYGLANSITIGGGMEYLSSVTSGKSMPFLNASVRVGNNFLITGEHTYGVRSKGVLSYHLPSNLQIEVDYTKYAKGQTAIRSGIKSFNNYVEEKKAVVSIPFTGKKFSAFSRLSYNQFTLTNMKYTTAEFLVSGIFKRVNSNFTTSAVYSDPKHPLLYSNLSATFRLPKGLRITPQVQYEYTKGNITLIKGELQKNIFNQGFLNLSYEKNIAHNMSYFSLGIRYNFSFAQTSFSITQSDDVTSTVQSARGSLLYDDISQKISVNNQTSVGKGGLTIIPFLDYNWNGIRDAGEPKVQGLKVRVNGGRIVHNKKDTSISILGLEAYANYFVELDRGGFDNVSWQIKKKTINISIEPNHFKLIQVPVTVAGEVSGTVNQKTNKGDNGIARIIVNIYSGNTVVARVLTESDGYFNYIGLAPGQYSARIDESQLSTIHMASSPAIFFSIKRSREGDVVDGLKFIIQPANSNLVPSHKVSGALKDSDGDGVPDSIDKELITPASCFPVDENGVGKCPLPECCKPLPPDKDN